MSEKRKGGERERRKTRKRAVPCECKKAGGE